MNYTFAEVMNTNVGAYQQLKINKLKEENLLDEMQDLERQMKNLEDYVRHYWREEAPEVYDKLIIFLNKKFERIDELFYQIEDLADPMAINIILEEIAAILNTLEKRINVVEKFVMMNDDFSLSA